MSNRDELYECSRLGKPGFLSWDKVNAGLCSVLLSCCPEHRVELSPPVGIVKLADASAPREAAMTPVVQHHYPAFQDAHPNKGQYYRLFSDAIVRSFQAGS
jgi:hypothetical protein